jgi:excisionase family DNA binding protein
MKDGDWVTVTEAARLLGVHRNTVRNRIKAGRYKAHKVVTPQGETYMVERESLSTPLTTTPHNLIQAVCVTTRTIPYKTHNRSAPL